MKLLANAASPMTAAEIKSGKQLHCSASETLPAIARYHQYLKERFPLAQLLALTAIIALLASIGTQVFLYGHLSNIPATFASFAAALLFLLRLRLVDELKDLEHDRRFYPERPIARGLIRPREAAQIAGLLFILEILVAVTGGGRSLIAFAFVAFYSFLTLKEFFVRDWLRKHFTTYVLSHEALVLPVCIYLYSLNGLALREIFQSYFYLLTAFIFGLLFLIEVARKLRPGEIKKNPRDTYTAIYGALASGLLTGALALLAVATGIFTADLLGNPTPALGYSCLILFVPLIFSLLTFIRQPNLDASKNVFKWSIVLVVGASALFILNAGLAL